VCYCLEKYLSMSLEDKRQLYACGTKFTTLEQVKTWSQHVPVKMELPSGMVLLLFESIFGVSTHALIRPVH